MTIREIKRHIHATREIVRITDVMYLLAARRLSKEKIRSNHGRLYFKTIQRLLKIAYTHAKKKDSDFLIQRPISSMLYIVITPNQGFCGGLPSTLNRLAVNSAEEQQSYIANKTGGIAPTIRYLTVGKKGRDFFTRTHRNLLKEFTTVESQWTLAIEIMQVVSELFQKGEIDVVFLVYAHTEFMVPRPLIEQLLPINLPLALDHVSITAGANGDEYSKEYALYFFAPKVERIFPDLVLRYLVCKIYVALLEGTKSENTARMIAMKHATERAKETLDHLNVVYNLARQAQITEDLLEIVSAAEALREDRFP